MADGLHKILIGMGFQADQVIPKRSQVLLTKTVRLYENADDPFLVVSGEFVSDAEEVRNMTKAKLKDSYVLYSK